MPDPDFERFRTALLRREPDRVPLGDMHADVEVKEAFLGRPIRALEDEVDFWYRAGYDYACLPMGVMYAEVVGRDLRRSDLATAYEGKAHPAAWAEEGFGPLATQAGLADFPWPDPDAVDLDQYRRVPLRPGMQVIAYFGKIYTYTWMQMGMTGFAVALYEDPNLVARVFEEFGRRHLAIFERILELPDVGGVWIADDLAYTEGMLVNPQVLRRHVFPWYKRMGDMCRARGLLYIFHSDGDIRPVIPDLAECGFHAIHPIEPKAMDIRQLKRDWGSRLALVGNLDLKYTLTRGTPEEVREEVRGLIRDVAPGGGYACGSSNSVTYYVPLANFNAMREAVFEFGRYPISV
jgi:uroporphyrinogen decarboxylase